MSGAQRELTVGRAGDGSGATALPVLGLVAHSAAWEQMLERTGFPFARGRIGAVTVSLHPGEMPRFPGEGRPDSAPWVLVCEAGRAPGGNWRVEAERVFACEPEEFQPGDPHKGNSHGRTSCVRVLRSADANVACVELPFVLDDLTRRQRAVPREFLSDSKLVGEWTAAVNWGNVTGIVYEGLRLAFTLARLPAWHVWWYPDGQKTLFNLRVDGDVFEPEDQERLMQALSGYERCTSWFLVTSEYGSKDTVVRNLVSRGAEVQSHGHVHHNWRSSIVSALNIGLSQSILRRMGAEGNGFAAPYGVWHQNLQRALERRGVEYSSDFRYAYSTLPLSPWSESCRWECHQVPIYPLCLGNFVSKAQAPPDLVSVAERLFCAQLAASQARRTPAFVYCHPDRRLGRYPGFTKALLDFAVGNLGLTSTRLIDFSRWWKLRIGFFRSIRLTHDGARVNIEAPWAAMARAGVWLVSAGRQGEIAKAGSGGAETLTSDLLEFGPVIERAQDGDPVPRVLDIPDGSRRSLKSQARMMAVLLRDAVTYGMR